jgi:hypothetical protein
MTSADQNVETLTLLNEKEIGVILGGKEKPPSHALIYRLRNEGILKATYIGSNVRFRLSDIQAALDGLAVRSHGKNSGA